MVQWCKEIKELLSIIDVRERVEVQGGFTLLEREMVL